MLVPCPDCGTPLTQQTHGSIRIWCTGCGKMVTLPAFAPFAPFAPIAPFADDEFRARGSDLIIEREAEGPPRCVRCNAPSEHRWTGKVYWHPPALYWTLLLGPLVYLLVATVVRKSSMVHLYLCREHRGRRRTRLALGWTLVGMAVLGTCYGIGILSQPRRESLGNAIVIGSLFVLFASLVWISIVSRVVAPRRIEDDVVTLRGAGREFLASLGTSP